MSISNSRSRFSRSLLLAAFCLVAGFSSATAQAVQGPMAPPAAADFEKDKAGQRMKIDFSLPIKPVSNSNLKFSQFKGKKMLIFYFSAQCPHCQHAAPYVQRLADELSGQGFGALSIAITYNSDEDIRGFIRDFGVRMPVMQDDQNRSFGENYGTRTIPVLYLVNEKGEYYRWKSFEDNVTPGQIRAAAAKWAPAKKK
jgi:thiol-disulfide isomerase/thioredoxin